MKPNIVFMHCHDLGQHISPYGITTVNTPHLDRFAEECVTFEKSFCTSPGCSPSRAALFTGRYPHTTGVLGLTHANFMWRLHDDEDHLAQILSRDGYRSTLVNIFHEHDVNDVERLGYDNYIWSNTNASITGEDAAKVIDKYAKEETDAPFFLTVGFYEPHRTKDGTFLHGSRVAPDTSKGLTIPPYIPQETDDQKRAAEKELAELQGAVREADKGIGMVLDALRAHNLMENTIVIFTADHGLALPRAKCTLYDPGIEVPLMIHAPMFEHEKGARLKGLVSNVDVVPTLLEMVAVKSKKPLEGTSFLSYMTGGNEHRDRIFAEKTYHTDYDPIRCIRTKDYKFIMNFEVNTAYQSPSDITKGAIYRTSAERYVGRRAEVELYDLTNDPWEQKNVADEDAYQRIREEMLAKLIEHLSYTSDPILDGPVPSAYNAFFMQKYIRTPRAYEGETA